MKPAARAPEASIVKVIIQDLCNGDSGSVCYGSR